MGILDDQHYEELPGRTLESVGRLLRRNVRMYLYPRWDAAAGKLTTAETVQVPTQFRHLYAPRPGERLRRSHRPHESGVPFDRLGRGAALIQSGDPSWDKMVPPAVAAAIKQKGLFGWKAMTAGTHRQGAASSSPTKERASPTDGNSIAARGKRRVPASRGRSIPADLFPRTGINATNDANQFVDRHRMANLVVR